MVTTYICCCFLSYRERERSGYSPAPSIRIQTSFEIDSSAPHNKHCFKSIVSWFWRHRGTPKSVSCIFYSKGMFGFSFKIPKSFGVADRVLTGLEFSFVWNNNATSRYPRAFFEQHFLKKILPFLHLFSQKTILISLGVKKLCYFSWRHR